MILTTIIILSKVSTRLKLPEHRQQVIVALRRSEAKDPLGAGIPFHHFEVRIPLDDCQRRVADVQRKLLFGLAA